MNKSAAELAKLLRYRPKFAASFSSTIASSTPTSSAHSPWFPKLKVVAAVGVGLGMGAIGLSVLGSEPRRSLYLLYSMSLRLGRDFTTAAMIVADYNYSLYGLAQESLERAHAKHEAHIRSANRLKELCFKNGGIYIKLGQHIGQLEYLLPSEYVQTMKNCMLDKCPVSTFEQVCELFKAELGRLPDEVFKDFDPVPLASASLAQVHVAHTSDGKKVAVKVQHTHLTDTAAMDIATVTLVVRVVHFLFPNFDYRWLIAEVQDSLPKELDFIHEAKNGERCMNNFRTLSPHLVRWIYVPKVYWDLSTPKLLTMEFIDGVKVTDVKAIQKLGVRPNAISKIMNQAFAEMIFRHGFVHCDPHAANMMVRLAPSNDEHGFSGKKGTPQLVLLDHGLYKELNPTLRNDYAALWKALVFADVNEIKKQSVNLGAGEDLYVLFAGMLTMRPWKKIIQQDINHLKIDGTEEDKTEIQMYASQLVSEISLLLQRLPREILLLLKTNDCLRAVDYCLGSSVNTFVIIARESSRAVAELKTSRERRVWSRLSARLDMLKVEVRLLILQLLEWAVLFWRSLPVFSLQHTQNNA